MRGWTVTRYEQFEISPETIATYSLLTATDRFKKNDSIDISILLSWIVLVSEHFLSKIVLLRYDELQLVSLIVKQFLKFRMNQLVFTGFL